jgi:hypothetical protein
MTSSENAKDIIRAALIRRDHEADEARNLAQRNAQLYAQRRVAAREKDIADRTRLLAVAKYAAELLVKNDVAPDTRLESWDRVVPQKRKFLPPWPKKLYSAAAEGWKVGRPSEKEVSFHTGTSRDDYGQIHDEYDTQTFYAGFILALDGDLYRFYKADLVQRAPLYKPSEVTVYRGYDNEVSTVKPLEPELPLSIEAAQKIPAGSVPPVNSETDFSHDIVERDIIDLVVNLLRHTLI